jgi:hypothetical protein
LPAGERDFSLRHIGQTSSGVHIASYKIGTGDTLPGVERPGRDAYLPSTYSDEVEQYLYPPAHLPCVVLN